MHHGSLVVSAQTQNKTHLCPFGGEKKICSISSNSRSSSLVVSRLASGEKVFQSHASKKCALIVSVEGCVHSRSDKWNSGLFARQGWLVW